MPHIQGSEARIHYEQFGEGPDIVWVSGGGDSGNRWHKYQIPFFQDGFRNTTFDNRGIGRTHCDAPLPWTFDAFARDTAELIQAVCDPPVAAVGLSMGSCIVPQLALDAPRLVRCAIVMGTGANSVGWCFDYQKAEMDFRAKGGRLEGTMGVAHYAAMLYPARVLGDQSLWPSIREDLLEWMESGENEESLIAQWDPCINFDQTDRLPGCSVPIHVLAFTEDVEAPPQDGKLVADLAPKGEYHLLTIPPPPPQKTNAGSGSGCRQMTRSPFIH